MSKGYKVNDGYDKPFFQPNNNASIWDIMAMGDNNKLAKNLTRKKKKNDKRKRNK